MHSFHNNHRRRLVMLHPHKASSASQQPTHPSNTHVSVQHRQVQQQQQGIQEQHHESSWCSATTRPSEVRSHDLMQQALRPHLAGDGPTRPQRHHRPTVPIGYQTTAASPASAPEEDTSTWPMLEPLFVASKPCPKEASRRATNITIEFIDDDHARRQRGIATFINSHMCSSCSVDGTNHHHSGATQTTDAAIRWFAYSFGYTDRQPEACHVAAASTTNVTRTATTLQPLTMMLPREQEQQCLEPGVAASSTTTAQSKQSRRKRSREELNTQPEYSSDDDQRHEVAASDGDDTAVSDIQGKRRDSVQHVESYFITPNKEDEESCHHVVVKVLAEDSSTTSTIMLDPTTTATTSMLLLNADDDDDDERDADAGGAISSQRPAAAVLTRFA